MLLLAAKFLASKPSGAQWCWRLPVSGFRSRPSFSASLGPPPERGRIREVWTLSLRWFFLDPPPERKRIREVGVASF